MVAPGLGFSFQNRGAGFQLTPGLPNSLAGRKRPLHTIIPAFMEKGDMHIGFGIMGGWNQAQAHAQFVANVVDYGMNVQAALEQPRFTKETFEGCDRRDGGDRPRRRLRRSSRSAAIRSSCSSLSLSLLVRAPPLSGTAAARLILPPETPAPMELRSRKSRTPGSRMRKAVPAPDFSPGERVFKPAETLEQKIGALALVAASQPRQLCSTKSFNEVANFARHLYKRGCPDREAQRAFLRPSI